jgi:predicted secreted protein
MSEGAKRIVGLEIHLGGEEPTGWLPPGASKPLPTPVRDVLVDLTIEFDGSGYLLVCCAQDGSFCWDTWHESLADAEQAAADTYGVRAEQWLDVG